MFGSFPLLFEDDAANPIRVAAARNVLTLAFTGTPFAGHDRRTQVKGTGSSLDVTG
jgi:hypothetical protein